MSNEKDVDIIVILRKAIRAVCIKNHTCLFTVEAVMETIRTHQKKGEWKNVELAPYKPFGDKDAVKQVRAYLLRHDQHNTDMDNKFIPYREEIAMSTADGTFIKLKHNLKKDHPFMWVDQGVGECVRYYKLYVEYSNYIVRAHAQTHDRKVDCGEAAGLLGHGEVPKLLDTMPKLIN